MEHAWQAPLLHSPTCIITVLMISGGGSRYKTLSSRPPPRRANLRGVRLQSMNSPAATLRGQALATCPFDAKQNRTTACFIGEDGATPARQQTRASPCAAMEPGHPVWHPWKAASGCFYNRGLLLCSVPLAHTYFCSQGWQELSPSQENANCKHGGGQTGACQKVPLAFFKH